MKQSCIQTSHTKLTWHSQIYSCTGFCTWYWRIC